MSRPRYRYDSLYRLKEAVEKTGANQNWIQNWEYDRYGNRTVFTQNIGGNTSARNPTVVAGSNRFGENQGFTYDKNGNVVNDIDPLTSHNRLFTFNGDNKQIAVKDTSTNITKGQYFYDGEGKRVKKVNPETGETTIFVYSSGKLVAEYSTATPPANPSINYTTTDHLGSPRIITDAIGQVKSRRDFLPFGEEVTPNVGNRSTSPGYSATDNIRQKFTGYQKDTETSLDFAEARMYENRFGRFTAVDPLLASGRSVSPQTFNRYTYVLNNPIVFVDADGLYPVYWDGKNLYSRHQYKGFIRYDGPKVTIKGHNGYYYTVAKDELTRGRSWKKAERSLERRMTGSLPTEAKSKPKPYVNHELIDALAREGSKKQTIMFVAAGIGAIGGACAALCPGAAVATAGAAGSGGASGIGAGAGTFTFTFGVGVGAERLVNGGDLSKQLSGQLADIYAKYPACSGACQTAAQEANAAFRGAGIDSSIVEIRTETPNVVLADGRRIGDLGFHQAVQIGDRYYDAVTGTTGATWEEYQKLFQGQIRQVQPRPYIPPQEDEP